MLTLSVLRCPDAVPPEIRRVNGGEFRIGRGPENDWVMPDPERLLSKRHCVIAFRNGGWAIADTSTNGTFLNRDADPLGAGQVRNLTDGDRIRLGAYEIEVRITQDQAGYSPAASRGAFNDPFGDDPLGAPQPAPATSFSSQAFGASDPLYGGTLASQPSVTLPTDFDPLAPTARNDFFGAPAADQFSRPPARDALFGAPPSGNFQNPPTQPDHSASFSDAFTPPRAIPQIPDDEDDWDLGFGPGKPAAPIAPPPPPAQAFAPLPSVPELPPQVPSSAPVLTQPSSSTPLPPPQAFAPRPVPVAASPLQEQAPQPLQPQSVPILTPPLPVQEFAPQPPPVNPFADEPPAPPAPIAVPPVSIQTPPIPPAPTPAALPPGAQDAMLAAFLEGAGLNGTPENPEVLMRALGAAFRATVSGIRQALIARASIKGEFRIEQTMIRSRGNNPLKFSADDDDALGALLGLGRRVDITAEAAVADALRDMRLHELATVAAMQEAVRALLAQLSPAALRSETDQGSALSVLPTQKKARAFDAFEKLHESITRALADDFDSVFGKSFARAYEIALHDISARDV